jgi:hypothetical protein
MRTLLAGGLLTVIGAATAFALIGVTMNTHTWGELITPALAVAGLLAFGLGGLAFRPPRRRST